MLTSANIEQANGFFVVTNTGDFMQAFYTKTRREYNHPNN
ncbi:hypothetical protein C427_0263 [Paraglaciecola psychrophila 170]|uniref:Uncharacterized protein n=1 Tax=Paraglaciecola psychrophila 170 TaxID=1129794 RepID=K7AWT5_9ALTE|nr:hypothetical protein C427_0263 [Paraglaciecola psychrophila 170]GAC39610.1 hypothetical protein GPSY_3999 [Paraglaciecola psychrophila 170]